MNYLTYRQSDGYVVAITADMPTAIEDGYGVATSEHFKLGDEFEHYIKIYVDEIKNDRVTSHAAVRQAPPAQELLLKISQLEKATGMGADQKGTKGIAHRLDALEARLDALEGKVMPDGQAD